jgi:hypothetical protein
VTASFGRELATERVGQFLMRSVVETERLGPEGNVR